MYLSQEEQQKYTRVFDSFFINTWNSFLENNTEFFTPVTFCQGKQTHWFIRCMSKEFEDEIKASINEIKRGEFSSYKSIDELKKDIL